MLATLQFQHTFYTSFKKTVFLRVKIARCLSNTQRRMRSYYTYQKQPVGHQWITRSKTNFSIVQTSCNTSQLCTRKWDILCVQLINNWLLQLLLFASVGVCMHVVAGSLMVHNWRKMNGSYYYVHNNEIHPSKQYMDMLISAAVFTFVNAAIFVAEIISLIRYSKEVR